MWYEQAEKRVEGIFGDVLENAKRTLTDLKDGEIIEVGISGWVERKGDGYKSDIWYGVEKLDGIDTVAEHISKHSDLLETFSKSLTLSKIKILAYAYNGASESELSEKTGLRGGALHYHLKDLLLLNLLRKNGRGQYETTRYGSRVLHTAVIAIRTFRRALEEGDEQTK